MAGAKPDTWMPMFWGDYLRDTGHLSTAEHGAYILLIGHYWTTGKPIPDSDAVMARITRQGMSNWRKMRDTIAAFFVIQDGVWCHGRIDAELDRAMRFIEKQAANGARGGRPRNPNETQAYPKRNPELNPNHKPTETTSPSPPNNSSHGKTITDAACASASPDGPPRPRLTSDEEWTKRLQAYDPSNPRKTWKAFWGWPPDTNGNGHLVPAHLVQWWKAQKAQQRTGVGA